MTLLPAKLVSDPPGGVISCPACDQSILLTGDVESWRQRALAAEQRAGGAHAAIRAGLLTQLGRLLRERLVSGLVSQRKELLDAQQAAVAEMTELERRLDDLRTPLKERLHVLREAHRRPGKGARGQGRRGIKVGVGHWVLDFGRETANKQFQGFGCLETGNSARDACI